MRMRSLLPLLALLFSVPGPDASEGLESPANSVARGTESENELRRYLQSQGIPEERILGVDDRGVPVVCGVVEHEPAFAETSGQTSAGLPADTRGWESIPGVVRADGLETFRVEVDVNGPVAGVTMEMEPGSPFVAPPEPWPVTFHDDGVGADRVADDFVYTAGPFRFTDENAPFALPEFYAGGGNVGSDSAPGVNLYDVGRVRIQELVGDPTEFLQTPQIGFLAPDIAAVPTTSLSPDIVVSRHLINIRSSDRATQQLIHGTENFLPEMLGRIYQVVPDDIDFFILFSTDKIERVPRQTTRNFAAGIHMTVQLDYTGADSVPPDSSALYGSDGRLLAINVLDTGTRGIRAANVTHELTHYWAERTDDSLGIGEAGHYKAWSSAGSLVGGFRWVDNGDGTFTLDCDEGRNGAHRAPPLDKYMMGTIDADSVVPLHVNETLHPTLTHCGEMIVSLLDVTIEEIVALQGERMPGPATAQRDFTIAFVAESHERLLTPTEMTFYEILAQHYTKVLPPDNADPYMRDGWVPVTRFFGETTTWNSAIPGFASSGPAGEVVGRRPATPLLLDKAPGGKIVLGWGASCRSSDSDYAVYEGLLGDFSSHVPALCSTAGAVSTRVTPHSGDRYYLVVPKTGDREGAYGADSTGRARRQSATPCLVQEIAACE